MRFTTRLAMLALMGGIAPPLLSQTPRPPVARWVSELLAGNAHVMEAAAESLAKHPRESVPPLVAALRDTTFHRWSAANYALREVGYPALPSLMTALRAARPGNPMAIKNTVLEICYERAVCDSTLLAAVHDRVAVAREAAIAALRLFNEPDTVPDTTRVALVVGAVYDPNAGVRRASVYRLKDVGALRGVVDALIGATADSDSEVRASAVYSLDHKGNGPVIRATLVRVLLQDSDPLVKVRAAMVLGWMGLEARSIGPSLIEALGDSDAFVRSAVARTVGAVLDGDTSRVADAVVTALEQRLKDDSAFVRVAASDALGAFGPKGVGGLKRAATDQHSEVREVAVYWLARRAVSADVLELFGQLLSDSNPEVRRSAAYALGGTDAGTAAATGLLGARDSLVVNGARRAIQFAEEASDPRVAGLCYDLAHSAWSSAPAPGDEDFLEFPHGVRFTRYFKGLEYPGDSVRMELTPTSPQLRGRGPGPGSWQHLKGTDSIDVVWTNGMSGVSAHLLPRNDSLFGFASSFWDYTAPTQRVVLTGRQVPCQTP